MLINLLITILIIIVQLFSHVMCLESKHTFNNQHLIITQQPKVLSHNVP